MLRLRNSVWIRATVIATTGRYSVWSWRSKKLADNNYPLMMAEKDILLDGDLGISGIQDKRGLVSIAGRTEPELDLKTMVNSARRSEKHNDKQAWYWGLLGDSRIGVLDCT